MIRKLHQPPSYGVLETEHALEALDKEMAKIKPRVEITLAGGNEIALGKITEWVKKRHFFTVKFTEKSPKFDLMIERESGLRAFFKAHLFSAPVVFKSTTVRRLDEMTYHYRIPEDIYQQQRRGALRVPLEKGIATLLSAEGDFPILDLSSGGAKIQLPEGKKLRVGMTLSNPILRLGRKKITGEDFEVSITSSTAQGAGCRFGKLVESEKAELKRFLIEALRTYYVNVVKAPEEE